MQNQNQGKKEPKRPLLFYSNWIQRGVDNAGNPNYQELITLGKPLSYEGCEKMGVKLLSSLCYYMIHRPKYEKGQVTLTGLILDWQIAFNTKLGRFAYKYKVQISAYNVKEDRIWLWEDKIRVSNNTSNFIDDEDEEENKEEITETTHTVIEA